MNAKEYLSQAWYLDKRIKTKERQLDWLRSHAAYVSPKISDEPKVSVSGRRSPVEEAVVRITELETEINNSIANLMMLVSRQIVLSGRRPKVAKCFDKCRPSMVH